MLIGERVEPMTVQQLTMSLFTTMPLPVCEPRTAPNLACVPLGHLCWISLRLTFGLPNRRVYRMLIVP